MTSPSTHSVPNAPLGAEGGDPLGRVASLDPFLYQDSLWCVRCGGRQTFVPVDRFVGGWRGYCLGCEEEKFVMVSRAESEAA